MPMPAITTGIIHIEIDCTPAKSNAVLSIGIYVPPTGTPDEVKTIVPVLPTATPLLASLIDTPRIELPLMPPVSLAAVQISGTAYAKVADPNIKILAIENTINVFFLSISPNHKLRYDVT